MGNDTKRLIKESLIGLLNDKPFDGICIKELTDACGISRNTFYYHYHDIYEVLEEIFDEHTKQHIGEADTWELWEDGILASLEFVLQNRKAVYHVYNSLNRENLERYINRVMSPITLRFVKQQAQGLNVSEEDIDILVTFYKHGVIGVFFEWLDSNMKDDPEQRIKRMGFMMRGTIRKCREKTAK